MNKNKYLIDKNPSFWKEKLSEQEFNILVEKGTDRAFENKYNNHQKKGIYVCAACNQILFSSEDKFDSGSGWPSFNDIIFSDAINTRKDHKLSQERTEALCSRCGGHLGHIFRDGPEPTGNRYCINSSSLHFLQKAYLALGCFWGPDASFGAISGVYFTNSGYAGGKKENPTYTSLGEHTETIEIFYNPEVIKFSKLLSIYWKNHNPYQKSVSSQYKSIIFHNTGSQKKRARKFIKEKQKNTEKKITTELTSLDKYYKAEDYHQNYNLRQNKYLNQFTDQILESGEILAYSKILTKLNAYSFGHLEKSEITSKLNKSYLYLKNQELINKIIQNL